MDWPLTTHRPFARGYLIPILALLIGGCYTYQKDALHRLEYGRAGRLLPTSKVGPYSIVVTLENQNIDSNTALTSQVKLRAIIQTEYLVQKDSDFDIPSRISLRIDSLWVVLDTGLPSVRLPIHIQSTAKMNYAASLPAWRIGPTFSSDSFTVDTVTQKIRFDLFASAIRTSDDSLISSMRIYDTLYAFDNYQSIWTRWEQEPNPFSPTTTISYDVRAASSVLITIYNVMGQVVDTLVNAYQQAGHYQTTWENTTGLASGVYFYRAQIGDLSYTRKLFLLK